MKVAVLMGGTSDERDVSLSSGAQGAGALREAGHEVIAVDTVHGVLSSDAEAALFASGVRQLPTETTELAAMDEQWEAAREKLQLMLENSLNLPVHIAGERGLITDRELIYELLELLVERAGQVVTRDELSRRAL